MIISYFARKGELLFTNSDQIEAERLCELSKKEKKSVHYMNISRKKNSAKDRLGIHCPVSCMMLKVVNLHQKPRKNRSQRKLELKYQGKYPQNREPKITPQTQCHFLLPDRPKNCIGMALCDIVTFQTVNRICHTVDFFSGIKNLCPTWQNNRSSVQMCQM